MYLYIVYVSRSEAPLYITVFVHTSAKRFGQRLSSFACSITYDLCLHKCFDNAYLTYKFPDKDEWPKTECSPQAVALHCKRAEISKGRMDKLELIL